MAYNIRKHTMIVCCPKVCALFAINVDVIYCFQLMHQVLHTSYIITNI